ncbi:tetratricopeptide repeat protein [bacterium SCSIO 12741]|nr:tetratricopeptide repeat protein [bacterium SCSIO 12741]
MKSLVSILAIFFWMGAWAYQTPAPVEPKPITPEFKQAVDSLMKRGLGFLKRAKYDSAALSYSDGVKLYTNNPNDSNLAIFHNNWGVAEYYRGNLPGCIEHYEIAKELYNGFGFQDKAAQTKYNLALVYSKMGMYYKAYDLVISSQEHFNKINSSADIARGYNSLGNIQMNLEDYDRSIQFHKKALKVRVNMNNEFGIASSLNNIGHAYLLKNELDSAETNLRQALRLKKRIKNPSFIASTQWLLGMLYFKNENLDSSKFYYEKALENRQVVGDEIMIASTMAHLANVLISENQLSIADSLLESSWVLAKENDANKVLLDIAEIRISWSEKKADAKLISNWYTTYNSIHRKIVGIEKREAVERLQVEFDVKRNLEALAFEEQRSQLLEEKNDRLFRTNTLLTLGIITLFLLTAALIYLLKINRDKNRILQIQGVKLEHQAEQISLLHKEYKHRTKNHFAIISAMFLIHKRSSPSSNPKELLNEYRGRVDALAMINRHLVREESQKEEVDLAPYLNELIQNTELGYSGDRDIEVETDLEKALVKPDMAMKLGIVVNELMTNFFKYGISPDKTPILRITTSLFNGSLEIVVADNGPGYQSSTGKKDPDSGFGQNLIKTFIEELDGSLEVFENEGLTFLVKIPQKKAAPY